MKNKAELINNGIKQIKENKWIHYILIIVIGIILSISLSNIQIRDTHDGSLHMLRLLGTVDTLEIGQFPPLMNQNYCNGVGYSMNLFYPPLVTYLPLLIKIFTASYMTTLKIFGGICIIASGFTMYQYIYKVTNKRAIALFASIFYMIAPYKLANVYKRFAIGEFTAMVFIPWVFLGLYNLFKQDGKKHYYIAIGAIGLMLSHTVTTLYIALFFVIYVLFNIEKLKDKEIIKKCIINVIFILLVSMLFWMPMLEATSAAKYTIMDDKTMRTNGRFVADNVISFSQLFKDKGEENGTTFVLGIPTIFAIMLTFAVYPKMEKKDKEYYLLSIIFALISIFMTSRFFPWKVMPNIICKLQYPWRMMGFFIFFTSYICAQNIYYALKIITKKDILRLVYVFVFIIICVSSSMQIMSQFEAEDITKDEIYETDILENRKISHMRINRDYMPLKALYLQKTYVYTREDRTYILEGNANITNEKKENLKDEIELENIEKDTILEFPYYYYVGYKINLETENGIKEIKSVESENGYLSCVVDEKIDRCKITVEYVGTTITYVSYIISAISLIGFIIYIIYENKRNKSLKRLGDKNDKKDK